jgi:hypothetical protein
MASFRRAGGAALLAAGIIVAIVADADRPLGISLVVTGVFVLAHLATETAFHGRGIDYDLTADAHAGMREFAAAFTSTSGVILGLLAVFGDSEGGFSLTVKVGIGALAADILLGIVLVGLLLAAPKTSDQDAWNFIRYVFNLALWALALGLLCIVTPLLYE